MKFAKIIEKFKRARIGVIGDLMLDRYIVGNVERISPEAPAPVVRLQDENIRPGGAANTAANIAALGADTAVFGAVGDDAAGGLLLGLLNAEGIDTQGVIRTRKSTIEKTRVLALGQQIVRLDREDRGGLLPDEEKFILEKIGESSPEPDALVISDYAKGVITKELARTLLRLARRRGLPVIVAPKPSHFSFFRGVRIVVPNVKEVEGIMGRTLEREDDLLKAGRVLAGRALSPVLITRGKDGMILFENGSVSHIPSAAREVYDVTGAGDTVAAVLALALASGMSIYRAAVLANTAAGIVVGKRGTATVNAQELSAAVHSNYL